MLSMPDITQHSAQSDQSGTNRPVRDVADGYVEQLAELNPILATALGLPIGQDRLPDLSPSGEQAQDELRDATLTKLTEAERAAEAAGGFVDADERRCARL